MKKQALFICLGLLLPILNGFSQTIFKGKIVNNQNNPIVGATVVSLTNKNKGTITDVEGNFSIKLKEGSVQISSIGYETKKVVLSNNNIIVLNQAIENLEEVIVSASRETQKRQEVSASIGLLTENQIKETKAFGIEQLVNQVPGVFMSTSKASSNEQHFMATRSPISTKSLFLYVEDGLPIRPVAVFNHNALLEMNNTTFSRIEVLKGPASSIYGSEAIGGSFNFITKTRDFWEYDPVQDTWTQKADFGGLPRDQAVAFAIESKGKGYIGTGWTDSNFANDLWEYDPDTNAWTRKADFGGGARANAVGFSIGNKGYIGTGLGPDIFTRNKDLWEYNPDTDMWAKKADFGGVGITRGTGFAIGDKGYIGLGEDAGFTRRKDFWEYDPTTDQWSQITDFGGNGRHQAIGFAIGNKGYCGLGTPGQSDKDFWEYSPQMNTWTQVADYGGGNRNNVIGFSINNKGYIGTGLGRSGTGPGTTTFGTKDFWEYVPNAN